MEISGLNVDLTAVFGDKLLHDGHGDLAIGHTVKIPFALQRTLEWNQRHTVWIHHHGEVVTTNVVPTAVVPRVGQGISDVECLLHLPISYIFGWFLTGVVRRWLVEAGWASVD